MRRSLVAGDKVNSQIVVSSKGAVCMISVSRNHVLDCGGGIWRCSLIGGVNMGKGVSLGK